jgi:hypothetical protein
MYVLVTARYAMDFFVCPSRLLTYSLIWPISVLFGQQNIVVNVMCIIGYRRSLKMSTFSDAVLISYLQSLLLFSKYPRVAYFHVVINF